MAARPVVLWFTDWEDFVTTAEGPIDVNPLLPGQTSSFDIVGPVNPYASKFSVLFTEADGDTIPTAGVE